jgi:hypothetical protein
MGPIKFNMNAKIKCNIVQSSLSDLEMLAVLFGALIHDYEVGQAPQMTESWNIIM